MSCQPSTRGILQRGRCLVPKGREARADELDRRDHRDRDHRECDRVLREVLPAFIPNEPPGECHVSPQLAAFCSVVAAWFQRVVRRVPTSWTAAITAIVITASAIAYSARSCPRSSRINRLANVISAPSGVPALERQSGARPPGPVIQECG